MTPYTPQFKTEGYAEMARKAMAEGYDCVKYDFTTFTPDGKSYTDEDKARLLSPKTLAVFEERIAAVREAIGPDADIIIENHSSTDANAAIQIARMAEKSTFFISKNPTRRLRK